MKGSKQKTFFIAITTLLLSFLVQPTFAHFHYELPVKSTLISNNNQKLSAIQISWTYDEEVSDLMLKDQKNIKKLGKKLINDLEKIQYFTALKLDGKPIETGKVKQFNLEEIKHKDYSNLKLTFTLPITSAATLKGNHVLIVNHEDPTASAILYYDKPQDLRVNGPLQSKCKTIIVEKKKFEEGESPQDVKVVCKD